MRKFKVGNVYSADCFDSNGKKIDRKSGYWHFKIIEEVYGHHEGKACNLYIGIKVDMDDYQQPSVNYLIESFNSDGVSSHAVDNYFMLKRNVPKKQNIKIEQRRNLYFWNLPKEFKKEEPQINYILGCSNDRLKQWADSVKANPGKFI